MSRPTCGAAMPMPSDLYIASVIFFGEFTDLVGDFSDGEAGLAKKTD